MKKIIFGATGYGKANTRFYQKFCLLNNPDIKIQLLSFKVLNDNKPPINNMKKLISFSLILISTSLLFSQNLAKVVGIKDGDTIVVLDKNNNQTTLRLAEVDCPESGQPFGKNAKQYTSSQVFGKEIKYYKTDSDRYGRTIAKIYYDNGKYLSEEIIKAGFGWWYFQYSNNKELGNLEQNARKNKLGLWTDKNAISPSEWRHSMKN